MRSSAVIEPALACSGTTIRAPTVRSARSRSAFESRWQLRKRRDRLVRRRGPNRCEQYRPREAGTPCPVEALLLVVHGHRVLSADPRVLEDLSVEPGVRLPPIDEVGAVGRVKQIADPHRAQTTV